MKRILAIVLALIAAGLAYLLIINIGAPIKFDKEKQRRYVATINRLKNIRTAQVAYLSEHDKYTGSFDTLIHFLKTDSFRIVKQIGSLDDSADVAAGRVRRDTIFVPILDSLFKNDPNIVDSLPYVPFTHGRNRFEMAAGEVQTASKVTVQVFEAKVPNKVLLNGLDHQQIVNLDDKARQIQRYPGLKVGSLTEATNNSGNWE